MDNKETKYIKELEEALDGALELVLALIDLVEDLDEEEDLQEMIHEYRVRAQIVRNEMQRRSKDRESVH